MGRILLTIVIFCLAAFIVFTKDMSKLQKGLLLICLTVAEVVIIKMLQF